MESFPYSMIFFAALVALTLAACILILFRIREIDRSTRALAVLSCDIQREVMVLFQQVQALAALEKSCSCRVRCLRCADGPVLPISFCD
jgi:hypothetical protein